MTPNFPQFAIIRPWRLLRPRCGVHVRRITFLADRVLAPGVFPCGKAAERDEVEAARKGLDSLRWQRAPAALRAPAAGVVVSGTGRESVPALPVKKVRRTVSPG